MTTNLNVPNDAPRYRFMRYVRPPVSTSFGSRDFGPLFPTQPSTRKIRVGVDVQTLRAPSPQLLRVIGRNDEVDPVLLVQNETDEPEAWMSALECARWYRFKFTTVDEAPRSSDASTVWVTGFEDGRKRMGTQGHFFSVYQQLDHSAQAPLDPDSDIRLEDRHRAAALACAAGALGVDVVVTEAPTAGRHDVADNDIVVSVTPDQLIPLFGHYLRVTGNHVLESTTGRLRGGGTYIRNHNASSVSDLYLAGIDASVPHLTAIRLMAMMGRDQDLVQSTSAIAVRLSRAARAVDHLLAALSNGSSTEMERTDIAEATAEAFERILLYLCAALDRYSRVTRTFLDTELDPDQQRGSLTSIKELQSIIAQFEPGDASALESRASFARVIGQLRNRIHALPLASQHQLSRTYGSSTAVAVTLDGFAELDPGTTLLNQEQFDQLGIWNAQASSPFGPRTYAADIATLATTLFEQTLQYVELFSRFLVRTKPAVRTETQHPVLGCWADDPRPKPAELPEEALYRELLGWSDFGTDTVRNV